MGNRIILNGTSYFGRGARENVITELRNRNFTKALVVTDKNLLDAHVTNLVTDVLDKNDFSYQIYSDIKPNPTTLNVQEGVTFCRNSKADVIIAVGGGSAIDTAKAISIIMTNPEHFDVISLDGAVETKNAGMPIIALPTTAGTAAEVTINYVITNPVGPKKMVCVDPHDIPLLAIVDTELMASMPKSIASSTCMDALTHAIEGYITKSRNTMAQMFSMKAIQLIYDNLEKSVNEKNQEAINNVGLGQYIAGMAFSNVGLGIVHSMAHQLGAVYDTPHGLANAILLPTVMKFNGEVSYEQYREILTQAFHTDATKFTKEEVIKTFCEKIKDLSEKVGITQTIRDVGGKEKDIPMLADKAMEDPCKPGNPREVTREDFIHLYEEAM